MLRLPIDRKWLSVTSQNFPNRRLREFLCSSTHRNQQTLRVLTHSFVVNYRGATLVEDEASSRPPKPTKSRFVEDLPSESKEQSDAQLSGIQNAVSSSTIISAPAAEASITSPLRPTPLNPRHKPQPHHPFNEPSMLSSQPVRLLIASLGNPPPYHSTRHSAGHILLRSLASHLFFPPLTTRSKDHGNGYLSTSHTHPEYTLWQSSSLMNASGPGLGKTWRTFENAHKADRDVVTGLVLLHDELEAAPGSLVRRGGEASARGHNGIKSAQATLSGAGALTGLKDRFVRIGIGIGRPSSRDREDVSAYVLGQVTREERGRIEGAASELVGVLEREVGRMGKG